MFSPAIVVVAFNRPQSLERLLSSIDKAIYPDGEVPLCICIDYQNSDANRVVVQMAEDFVWNFGPKEIVHQTKNIGLKAHVLLCGDLSERFGSIIMLEDDLYVSPAFYDYSANALTYYQEEFKVGGVSLYSHKLNILNLFKFEPIDDGSDVFFLQIASSWGQAWTYAQWAAFKSWLIEEKELCRNTLIPPKIYKWPDSSWLKLFIGYLTETKKWFVYPRVSYTTNFGDPGTHTGNLNSIFQVPLSLNVKLPYKWIPVNDSIARYDAFFEIDPNIIKKQNKYFNGYDFECDLYGLKSSSDLDGKIVLTTKKIDSVIDSFGLHLRPIELNVINLYAGEEISFGIMDAVTSKDLIEEGAGKIYFNYFFGTIPFSIKLKNIKLELIRVLKNRFLKIIKND